MKKLFGLKSKKKSKTDTQAKQLSAYEPENESQQTPQAEEAPQQEEEQQAPQTVEAPQQQAPQTEEAPQQQAPQTEEAPQQQQQQQAPPQTVTQPLSEPQPERINYDHYNQFISPYRMEDDLEVRAIEFQHAVTAWMGRPPPI